MFLFNIGYLFFLLYLPYVFEKENETLWFN